MTMSPRERIQATIRYQPPDVLPLRILPGAGGLHKHGRKLVELIRSCGHDFSDLSGVSLPEPPGPEDFDSDGRYHAFRTDEWGTTWEYRIFGIWGHPSEWPLNDLSRLETYQPPNPAFESRDPEAERQDAARHKQRYYLLGSGGSIFEKMHSLRRFEDVLMDVTLGTPEIHRMADMVADNVRLHVAHSLAMGADGVAFGDDFGTASEMLVSPDVWRRFFKPRYRELFEPVLRANKDIFFHCCGQVTAILEDFRELGVTVIWPQLTAFELTDLAQRCRDLRLTVELHPDRGDLMQRGWPDQIRGYLARLFDVFDTAGGGSWLYVEIDPGFPFENVEALFDVAMRMRGQ